MISPNTIRKLRIFKGFKQQTVAKKLGISQPAFSKMKKSEFIKEERVLQILTILKCSMDELKAFEKLLPR